MFRRYIRAFSVGQWVRTDEGWTMTIPGNLGGNIWFHNRAPRLFGAIPKQVLIDFMKQTPFDLPTLAPGSDDDLLGTWIVGTWRKPSFTMDPTALTYQVEFIYARPKPDRYEGDKPADYASGNEVCGSH
jgi:hypothetical protein